MTLGSPAAIRALCLLGLLGGAGPACDRLRGRAPGGAEAPPAEEPAGEGTPAPAGRVPGSVTAKTTPPTAAKALSSAFATVARALHPCVVRIDVEIQQQPR